MKKNNYDAYAKYRYNYKPQKYSKKGNKVFAILFVLLCVSVVIFFSISFSNFLVVGKVVNINSSYLLDTKTLYALSLDSVNSLEEANKKSLEQQKQGGAGFVYTVSNSYYLVSSIYASQKDAQKVLENLKSSNIFAKVIKINLPAINLKVSLNSNSTKILSDGLNLFYQNYQSLYNYSLDFDKQNIDLIKLKSLIKDRQNQNLKIINEFSSHFEKSSNIAILYTKIYLNKLNQSLENLQLQDESVNLSSQIKQTYCKIINEYLNLCKEIN